MHEQELRLVEQIALRAAGEVVKAAPSSGLMTQAALRPGATVAGAVPGGTVQVTLVGDSGPIAAANVMPVAVGAGIRVMVYVTPQGGAFVVGAMPKPETSVTLLADGPISLLMPPGPSVRLIASLRSSRAVASDNAWMRVNGLSTAVYYDSGVSRSGATPTAYATENTTNGCYIGTCDGDSTFPGFYSPHRAEFHNADSASQVKQGLARSGRDAASPWMIDWLVNITAPILTVQLLNGGTLSPTWKAGSTARLVLD